MIKRIKYSDTFDRDDGLFDYIARKELDYQEPKRKGVPRGEKIGFTTQKYLASLLVGLTNIQLKKMATDLNRKYGLSYGLLRRWKTENDFKEAVQDHAAEFVDFLFDKFRQWVPEETKTCAENPEAAAGNWRIFEDAGILSTEVLDNLLAGVLAGFRELDQMEGDDYILEWVALYQILQLIRLAEGGRASHNTRLMADMVVVGVVRELISSKRVLSKREHRLIVDLLTGVEKSLESKIGKSKN